MGVKALVHLAIGREEAVGANLKTLDAQRLSHAVWRKSVTVYKPTTPAAHLRPPLDDLCVVADSDEPNDLVLLSQSKTLVASAEMLDLLDALRLHTVRTRVTAEGELWAIGDFLVRVGRLRIGSRVTGTLVEVEYAACPLAGRGAQALVELAELVLAGEECSGEIRASTPPSSSRLPSHFSQQHAALQLVALLSERGIVRIAEPVTSLIDRLEAAYVDRGAVRRQQLQVGDALLELLVAGPESSERLVLFLHAANLDARSWQVCHSLEAVSEAGVRAVAVQLDPKLAASSRTSHVEAIVGALRWERKIVLVSSSAAGALSSPFVLGPDTFQRVAGYISIAAPLDVSAHRPRAKARETDPSPRKTPTLLVFGDLDNSFPPDSPQAHDQAAFFSGSAHKVVLPGAGHACHLAAPEDFNRLLVDFVCGWRDNRKVPVAAEWT